MRFLAYVVIGIISGWLAGEIVKGDGFGLIGNLIVGVIGAFTGGVILDFFGDGKMKDQGFFAKIILSTLGAVVFLGLVNILFG